MKNTVPLFPLMNASPYVSFFCSPLESHSSQCSMAMFMYPSTIARTPWYSIPLLSFTYDVVTTGLQDYIVYDVPNFASTSNIIVNASQFLVDCYGVPEATQVGGFDFENLAFSIRINDELEDIRITPGK